MSGYGIYRTPFGIFGIEDTDGKITGLEKRNAGKESRQKKGTALTDRAYRELLEYFAGERKEFDLPVYAEGTEFQKKIWKELNRIPYGETRTYGEIAKAAGNPKASRAVGMACNRNPVGIIIPCHRVIGSDGKLTGYAGGLETKEKLLKLESGNRETGKRKKT